MPKQPAADNSPAGIVTVLSISPLEEDHFCLQRIFRHSNWMLYIADRIASALPILQQCRIGAILCERDLPPDTWVEMLGQTSSLPQAPPLIVTSRMADDRLWSQALNLGAYDVLAKPFDSRELIRSVSLAWLHWRSRHGTDSAPLKVLRAAS